MPPITATGMVEIADETFPMQEKTIASKAAPRITQTEYTRVIAMTPIFSP